MLLVDEAFDQEFLYHAERNSRLLTVQFRSCYDVFFFLKIVSNERRLGLGLLDDIRLARRRSQTRLNPRAILA